MARFNAKLADEPAQKRARSRAQSLVGREIELIMSERERLLRATGAAAALVSRLDVRRLPPEAIGELHRLGAVLGALTEETLADALSSHHATRGPVRGLSAAH